MNERAGSAATTGPARSRLRLPLRWLADLRLRGKFLIIVVLGAVIATAIGVTSLVSMSRMQATSDRIYRKTCSPSPSCGSWRTRSRPCA